MPIEANSRNNYEKFKDNSSFQKRIEKIRKRFEGIVKNNKNGINLTSKEGWKKFVIDKKGKIYIRCQGLVPNSMPLKQCSNTAMNGKLTCSWHAHSKDLHEVMKSKEGKKELGIYDMKGKHALKEEMAEIADISEEEMKSVNSEVKLTIALLRKYLKSHNDKQIEKSPGRLLWIINKLVEMKRTKWELSHSPEVSFSREQVNYVLSNYRTIVLNVVKNEETISKIVGEMEKFGLKIKTDGFG